jgi:hypothetical protein
MKLWLVCFANRRFAVAQHCLVRSAERFGFDRICAFDERHVRQTDFFRRHQAILSAARGAGYWLWKPYYIAEVLEQAAEDDVVVYCDSGNEFIADPRPLIEICQNGDGPMLFQTHDNLNIAWTKRDCFVGMDCDKPQFHHAQQLAGGLQIYRRCAASLEFVQSQLSYCSRSELLTDADNTCGLPNYPEFVEHRHDQSIMSLLAERWRLPIYRDPTQWGNPRMMAEFQPSDTPIMKSPHTAYENSPYGQIVNSHRRGKGPRRKGFWASVRALHCISGAGHWRRAA